MKTLIVILLASLSFAQAHRPKPNAGKPVPVVVKPTEVAKPAEPAKPFTIPEIPIGYQTKFKTLVIKQKDLQIDELSLQARYLADQKATDAVNAEGATLEAEIMATLKVDAKKYTVSYQNGEMVIVEKK